MAGTPAHADLLASYANTADLFAGTDLLANPEGLVSWLAEQGLVPPDTEAGSGDLEVARRLRDGLRAAMTGHHDTGPAPRTDLEDLGRDLPLRVSFAGPVPELSPTVSGVRGALAYLLVAVVRATHDGSWERLKLCRADDCRYAFHDESKNHSRTWCEMGVCGNRAKTRAYRQRRRARAT